MTTKKYFYFTIGPVQGFVAQARRTRDFWAGSFILSWLSAVAMKEVDKQGGTIQFPKADTIFLDWIEGIQDNGNPPTQGSIPNRFKAKVNSNFCPEKIEESVRFAWKSLADVIYKGDFQNIESEQTKKIWDRQIKGFWEISWVITSDERDSSVLDRRKNLRIWMPPDEAGVKCSLMDGWQELSGVEKPQSKQLEAFWQQIRKKVGNDLKKGEHLSAVAWVKRRFAHYFKDVDKEMKSDWTLRGWKLKESVPSVAYLAAVHWLENVLIQTANNEKVKRVFECFYNLALELTKSHGELNTRIKCIATVTVLNEKWKSLDGNIFFEDVLQNKNNYPDQKKAKKVVGALKKLRKSCNLGSVTPFYAVLLMDGDSLGKHMSDSDKQGTISDGLKEFTDGVKQRVDAHNGFLIYAGGDDVLALLPLEDAFKCAVKLRAHYLRCFKDAKFSASISGAIEFAHIHAPLTKILKDSHNLLDNVAKEGCGRDAIAVRVWKQSGKALEWAQPWDIALDKDDVIISNLAKEFAKSHDDSKQFSSSFFYKIRTYFDLLNPSVKEAGIEGHNKENDENSSSECYLTEEEAVDLMAMEYVVSHVAGQDKKEICLSQARNIVKPLLQQCRRVIREPEKERDDWEKSKRLEVDGALLVRFLARKGVE
ncbi:type III-B CRISPR-associated protein Cas10/Cmr2 [bacterium]|nr:type III-B CRISPR-associated protein Cas10/Cmr2 [bacterium]